MWKDSLHTVRSVVTRLYLSGGGVLLLGVCFTSMLLWAVGVVILLVGLVIHLRYYRCPACGKFLERVTGAFCSHCGAKIR